MDKYIVVTNGRYSPIDDERIGKNSLTMDVQTSKFRTPLSLEAAKARAREIVEEEDGVKAYICKLELVVERQSTPIITRKV